MKKNIEFKNAQNSAANVPIMFIEDGYYVAHELLSAKMYEDYQQVLSECEVVEIVKSNMNYSYLFSGGGNLRANIHLNTVSLQSASFNSSSVASVPNTAVINTRQVLFYNRTKSTEFEVHKNGVKQIVPAPSTAVEDSNLVIGSSSALNYLNLVGGYLISKGLTDTEISLFTLS